MTMTDMVCDVCHLRKAIGVASTSIPFSCAFCECCANYGADPELVFGYWAVEIGPPENHRCPGLSLTFKDGQYITYSEWYHRYGEEARASFAAHEASTT
jgi:hypothetical protein